MQSNILYCSTSCTSQNISQPVATETRTKLSQKEGADRFQCMTHYATEIPQTHVNAVYFCAAIQIALRYRYNVAAVATAIDVRLSGSTQRWRLANSIAAFLRCVANTCRRWAD